VQEVYYIGQIICNNKELTAIDWDSAHNTFLWYEVIMSYTYADLICRDGTINVEKFKKYLDEYTKYIALSSYDLSVMPYFYYYFICFTNFYPPYGGISADYRKIASLKDNLMDWLYYNVDDLSKALIR